MDYELDIYHFTTLIGKIHASTREDIEAYLKDIRYWLEYYDNECDYYPDAIDGDARYCFHLDEDCNFRIFGPAGEII